MRLLLVSCGVFVAAAAAAQALSGSFVVSNYGGFNISCKGGNNGSIDLTPTGGTPPYTYDWSNNATTQDLSGLTAGYYKVKIRDAANNAVDVQTTLTEPTVLTAYATLYEYGNGYNVSLFNAFNGSMTVTRTGGKTPYTQLWNDGNTSQNRTGLGADNYSFTITDANGCVFTSPTYQLTQPDRTDWTMGGNAGTNPATQFIGTSDNKDLSFKTNGQEHWRILATGELKAPDLGSAAGYSLLAVDGQGIIKRYSAVGSNEVPVGCPAGDRFPWLLCGNEVTLDQFIGSINAAPLVFKTDNEQRMIVSTNGKVGIGTTPPPGSIGQYRLFVEDGISTRDVLVKTGAWPDYVFDPRYELMPMPELREYLATNKHLPGIPSAADVAAKDGVEVGDMVAKLLKVAEEQALYILQLEERLNALELHVGR